MTKRVRPRNASCPVPLWFAITVVMLLVAPIRAQAQCAATVGPNPLALISIDFFDPITDTYVYTQAGSGWITVGNGYPDQCLILPGSWVTQLPLVGEHWGLYQPFSDQYRFWDGTADCCIGYPQVRGGVLYSSLFNYTTYQVQPIQGNIVLTIFKVYL